MTVVTNVSSVVNDLETADFDYELPSRLIAQTPLDRRDDSRLLVLDRSSGDIQHTRFKNLGLFLAPGDLLVANNSRVILARLRGTRVPTGGAVEILLLKASGRVWSALAKPAKRLRPGTRLVFLSRESPGERAFAVVKAHVGNGEVEIVFEDGADERLHEFGELPLPPYITEPLSDEERYQTAFSSEPGSAAAPTAGLHFTRELIADLRSQGIEWAEVTLHIGLDTFRPVMVERINDHRIHQEWCKVSTATARAIAECRQRGGRVVAVGTTAARTLETLGQAWRDTNPMEFCGMTDLFIVPGHHWRLVDALVTNFHLPRSTLLMMVSAFGGRDTVLRAYTEAIRTEYRFYSFGDAMLIRG